MVKELNDLSLEKVSGGLIVKLKPTEESLEDFLDYCKKNIRHIHPSLFEIYKTHYIAGKDGEKPFVHYSPNFESLEEAKAYAMERGWSTDVVVEEFEYYIC